MGMHGGPEGWGCIVREGVMPRVIEGVWFTRLIVLTVCLYA